MILTGSLFPELTNVIISPKPSEAKSFNTFKRKYKKKKKNVWKILILVQSMPFDWKVKKAWKDSSNCWAVFQTEAKKWKKKRQTEEYGI